VLDGDDGLSGEVLHQLDLFVGKWKDLLATECDRANQHIVLEHGDGENRAITGELDTCNHERMPRDIGRYRLDVGDVSHLLGGAETPERRVRGRSQHWIARSRLDVGRGRAVRGHHAKAVAVTEVEVAERGLAEPHRVFQHRFEYRLELAGRAR